MSELENRVKTILEQNGIFFYDDMEEILDLDSLTYVSILVELENEFQIDIPEQYLTKGINTFRGFCDMINKIAQIVWKLFLLHI